MASSAVGVVARKRFCNRTISVSKDADLFFDLGGGTYGLLVAVGEFLWTGERFPKIFVVGRWSSTFPSRLRLDILD